MRSLRRPGSSPAAYLVLRVEGDAVASITAYIDRLALREQLGLS